MLKKKKLNSKIEEEEKARTRRRRSLTRPQKEKEEEEGNGKKPVLSIYTFSNFKYRIENVETNLSLLIEINKIIFLLLS